MNRYHYTDGLQSQRLSTRFLTVSDAESWCEFFESPEAVKLHPPSSFKNLQQRSEAWVEHQLNRYRDKQYGLQALALKSTGEIIGQCGLLRQEIDRATELEVGYHVLHKHWGKGYAPEAARLFVNYAFENELNDSVIALIDVRNSNSVRVAEKLGMHLDKHVQRRGNDTYVFRITAADWLKHQQ